MKKAILVMAVALAVGTGCETSTGNYGLGGAAAGAALGAALNHKDGGKGALVGGALGGLGGAVIGNQKDKADKNK